jgi:hypothetical protein
MMTVHPVADRCRPIRMMVLGLVIAVGGGITLSSCSSSSQPSPAATTTAATTAAATPSSTFDTAAATQQVTTAWEAFFSKSTPLAQKAQYLQNGSQMTATIQNFASNAMVGQVTAKVDSVKFTSPTQATVTYDIDGTSGTALLTATTGQAVLQAGNWVVSDSSLCGLLSLTGGKVPGCS